MGEFGIFEIIVSNLESKFLGGSVSRRAFERPRRTVKRAVKAGRITAIRMQ